MRTLSLPKISTSMRQDITEAQMAGLDSPTLPSVSHSRTSSGASSSSVSTTPTHSSRGHGRWPSSSSLATTPDSPINVAKSPLHDVVEDPSETDDMGFEDWEGIADEEFCICDTSFCEHRRKVESQPSWTSTAGVEWIPGDDQASSGDPARLPSAKKRSSDDCDGDNANQRTTRRWPSISMRWRDHKPTTSVSSTSIRSAPPSRSGSERLPALRQTLASHLEPPESVTAPTSPVGSRRTSVTRNASTSRKQAPAVPLEIKIPEANEEPLDRQELASTPLLPPVEVQHPQGSGPGIQSPLQSPSVAAPSAAASAFGTPVLSPASPRTSTPPLSSKPSFTSIGATRRAQTMHHSPEVTPIDASDELDQWALKLGHANFYISPEPYVPEVCNHESCTRLVADWEVAQRDFMWHARRVGESYGPTSQTFKYTMDKWDQIEAQWRANFDQANATAQAKGELPAAQSLARGQPLALARIPSLNDPQQPAKFPKIDEADIVGPMVQYTRIHRTPPKQAAFLKFFANPVGLFRKRSVHGSRR